MQTGAEYIIKTISLLGVKNIFGIPGAHIDPLLIATVDSDVDAIINCHELSAAYMADGYSRASKKLGVIVAIGGPGANNIVTAVNTARIEKVPILIITGDVPLGFSNVPGFQCGNEMGSNDDDIFKPITKYSKRIGNINELVESLERAINIALTPPFGPTHLIIPYNIFLEKTPAIPKAVDYDKMKYMNWNSSEETIKRIKNLLLSNKKIIFWVGNSLNKKEQAKHILALAERFHIPVATSFSAKGVIAEDHELAIGNFGYAGSGLSKEIFLSDEPDVIIGFDIEQNERNSLNWNTNLYKGKELILVNYPGSYKNNQFGESIEDNPFYILAYLYSCLSKEEYDSTIRKQWFNRVLHKFTVEAPKIPTTKNGIIEPGRLIQIIQKELPNDTILFVDSGNHRMFAGFHWRSPASELYYSASIVAPLGWALAAGIGCKFNRKEAVVVFTGDGCMQMHGIELKTAVKYNIPILVVINNNRAYGSIFNRFSKISDETAKMASITEIDWNMFVKSFGAEVYDITSEDSFIHHIQDFLADQKLTVLNVRTPLAPYIQHLSLAKSAFV